MNFNIIRVHFLTTHFLKVFLILQIFLIPLISLLYTNLNSNLNIYRNFVQFCILVSKSKLMKLSLEIRTLRLNHHLF